MFNDTHVLFFPLHQQICQFTLPLSKQLDSGFEELFVDVVFKCEDWKIFCSIPGFSFALVVWEDTLLPQFRTNLRERSKSGSCSYTMWLYATVYISCISNIFYRNISQSVYVTSLLCKHKILTNFHLVTPWNQTPLNIQFVTTHM